MKVQKKITIWIDADACPRVMKEFVFKASSSLELPVLLVANTCLKIAGKLDEIGNVEEYYIVANVKEGDLVITSDIPLAEIILGKKATAINLRGELYTKENIQEKLKIRNLLNDIYDSKKLSGNSVVLFANSFNTVISKLIYEEVI